MSMKKILVAVVLGVFIVSCGSIKPAQKKSNSKTQELPPNTGSNKYSSKRNQ